MSGLATRGQRRAAGLMMIMGALGCVGGVVTAPRAGAAELATLRLRGGTGQGGPSRGFRSKGSNFKWRHPSTMFAKQMARKPEPKGREFLVNRATSISNEGMGRPTAYQSKYLHSKRSHQPWYIKFTTTRGKKWLDKALEDKAFRLGFMGIKAVEPEPELLDYDWKALAKVPRAWKVGLRGYGKAGYDVTNKYIGVGGKR